MKFTKLLLGIGLIIPLACHATQTDDERSLSVLLTQAVMDINLTGPQMLDEETRFDSVSTFKNYIIYNNTMMNYTAEQLDVSLFDPIIEEAVIDPLCANKALSSFIDLGVVMVYRYHGKDGQYVSELSKDMSSCKTNY